MGGCTCSSGIPTCAGLPVDGHENSVPSRIDIFGWWRFWVLGKKPWSSPRLYMTSAHHRPSGNRACCGTLWFSTLWFCPRSIGTWSSPVKRSVVACEDEPSRPARMRTQIFPYITKCNYQQWNSNNWIRRFNKFRKHIIPQIWKYFEKVHRNLQFSTRRGRGKCGWIGGLRVWCSGSRRAGCMIVFQGPSDQTAYRNLHTSL